MDDVAPIDVSLVVSRKLAELVVADDAYKEMLSQRVREYLRLTLDGDFAPPLFLDIERDA